MSVLAALTIGGLGLLGSTIGTAVNVKENKRNRQFSAAEAEKQRNWETQMSNTAVQRQVTDMEASGINPAMAFGGGAGGGGASTPHGAAAQASGSSSTAFDMINSAANLAAAFNYDKNKKNDVNLKQVTKASTYMQRNGIKDLNSLFSDLNNVKI